MSDNQGWPLFALVFSGPHMGVRARWPNVLHAVEMSGLPIETWPDGLATSVCGKKHIRLLQAEDGSAAPWPPYVEGLGDKVRCKECYDICKKKRPQSRFVRVPREKADAS